MPILDTIKNYVFYVFVTFIVVIIFAFSATKFFNYENTDNHNDVYNLLNEMFPENFYNNEREYYKTDLSLMNYHYANDKTILKLLKDINLINKMLKYLTIYNNTHFVTMGEVEKYEKMYSFGIIKFNNHHIKSCNTQTYLQMLFGMENCKFIPSRYLFEPVFDLCIIGSSLSSQLTVKEIKDHSNPFASESVKERKVSIKVRYKRIVFYEKNVIIDEVDDWLDNEISATIQSKIEALNFNQQRKTTSNCLYNKL